MEFMIVKVLTHNIVMAENDKLEYIILGKGIGFGKKEGETIDQAKIYTYYRIQDLSKMSAYEKIVSSTDESVLFATEEAIAYCEKKLSFKFDESIHISLLDHINFAIYRYHNNVSISNLFSSEYYLLYESLYTVSQEMINIINHLLDIKLPEYEIGALILHIHSAMQDDTVSTSALYAQIISDAALYLKVRMPDSFENNKLGVSRFMTHMKFALKRSDEKISLDNPIIELLKGNYKEAYQLSKEIAHLIDSKYGYNLPESEVGYIALHIHNIQSVSKKG